MLSVVIRVSKYPNRSGAPHTRPRIRNPMRRRRNEGLGESSSQTRSGGIARRVHLRRILKSDENEASFEPKPNQRRSEEA